MTDQPEYGPCMRALTDRQRGFVLAMAADPFGNAAKWARAAGYSDVKDGAKVRGHHLLHDAKVEAAVLEFAGGLMKAQGPIIAAAAILRVAGNPKHKNHLRAAEMLANRVGLHEVQEVHVRRTDETAAGLLARFEAAAAVLELSPDEREAIKRKLLSGLAPDPKLIEGERVA